MTTRGVVKLQKTTNYPNRQPPWPRVEDKGLLTGRIFTLKRNHSFVTKCKYWSRLCSRWMLVSERWRTVCYVSCPHLRTLNQLPTLTQSNKKQRLAKSLTDRKIENLSLYIQPRKHWKGFYSLKRTFCMSQSPPCYIDSSDLAPDISLIPSPRAKVYHHNNFVP